MRKVIIFIFFVSVVSSIYLFGKINGHWHQVFPANPPEPRYNHYMCPIGEQKVLMIGGCCGNVKSDETWLYDYKENTWTQVMCDTAPDTYGWTVDGDDYLCQISKNRVITLHWAIWLFDLDSMKWFKLDARINGDGCGTYLEENLVFNYTNPTSHWQDGGKSWLIHLHPEEPLDSPDFLSQELINDEKDTKFGPKIMLVKKYKNGTGVGSHSFKYFNKEKPVNVVRNDTSSGMFIDLENVSYKWLFYDDYLEKLPYLVGGYHTNLTNNVEIMQYAVFDYHNWVVVSNDYYAIEYLPGANSIITYTIEKPSSDVRNVRMAKIKDGAVMLFGGMKPDALSNDTWIFELEEGIIDNRGDTANIYTLDDNVYLLNEKIKDAALYNVLGQKVLECKGKIDLNYFPVGIYFLRYTENKEYKMAKILKY
jgi:hypothetical protein